MSLKTRLLFLFIGWLPVGIIYIAASFARGNNWIVPGSFVERLIPFSPSGIWLYLLFYVYIPYTFITANASKIKIMSLSFILSACISGICFVFLPSSMNYPSFEIDDISSWCLNFVRTYDTEQNCFPSLHGSLITICTLANWDRNKKIRSYGCILLTLLMYYSIIQVRRHVFIDLAAGVVLALLAWQFSIYILNRSKKPGEQLREPGTFFTE
jgi:membrane-associated phospholipid phosphatase